MSLERHLFSRHGESIALWPAPWPQNWPDLMAQLLWIYEELHWKRAVLPERYHAEYDLWRQGKLEITLS